MKILPIPVYVNSEKKIFCYKFHDALIRLSKISVVLKYGALEFLFKFKFSIIFQK